MQTLQNGYVNSVRDKTAGDIAKDFLKAQVSTANSGVKARLERLALLFKDDLVIRRNQLVHGTPFTAPNEYQMLGYSGKSGSMEWTEADMLKAAEDFAKAESEGNDLRYNYLSP